MLAAYGDSHEKFVKVTVKLFCFGCVLVFVDDF